MVVEEEREDEEDAEDPHRDRAKEREMLFSCMNGWCPSSAIDETSVLRETREEWRRRISSARDATREGGSSLLTVCLVLVITIL